MSGPKAAGRTGSQEEPAGTQQGVTPQKSRFPWCTPFGALGLGVRDPSFAWPSGLERVLDAARGPITPYVKPAFWWSWRRTYTQVEEFLAAGFSRISWNTVLETPGCSTS